MLNLAQIRDVAEDRDSLGLLGAHLRTQNDTTLFEDEGLRSSSESYVLIEVTIDEKRLRLIELLCSRFPLLSKLYLRSVVRSGMCEVNGRVENIGYRLAANDLVEIRLDLTRQASMVPQKIDLEILYEDEDLVVVNKPSGMLVHPSHREKTGTLLNALVHHLSLDGASAARPGLVHRLDKETSGLMVVAKNPRSHRILCRHFSKKAVEKRYTALVVGEVARPFGVIRGNIGRNAEAKRWELRGDGKPSETRFRVIRSTAFGTLLELEPVTGRTNQLRIHCAALGLPIVGDRARGGREYSTLCLHANRISFVHPSTGKVSAFSTAPPAWAEC